MGRGDCRRDGGVEGSVGEDFGRGGGGGDRGIGGGWEEFVGYCRREERYVGGRGEWEVFERLVIGWLVFLIETTFVQHHHCMIECNPCEQRRTTESKLHNCELRQ